MTHAHDRSSLETDYTREDREPTGRKGMVSKGIITHKGSIVDASFVTVPKRD